MDVSTEWVMCGRKISYRTRYFAEFLAAQRKLRAYECPLCYMWHLTKTSTRAMQFCECGKALDPYLPADGNCKKCAIMTEKKAIKAISDLMSLFAYLYRLPIRGPARQPKMTEEEKNLRDFSLSINRALVYLQSKQSKSFLEVAE